MKKYELLKYDTINHCGKTLYRIKALRDFSSIKKDDLGGYIEKEGNLDHEGACWVSDSARVSGSVCVYGEACVYGLARVSKIHHVQNITNLKYNLTFTPQNVQGGCRTFTHEEFASLELKDCQDETWEQWELDNYKSYQWLYLERLYALEPELKGGLE